MTIGIRRRNALGLFAAAALLPIGAAGAALPPRMRTIVDNDFAGDPDGVIQLAHHLLSPSVTIPFVIGSHLEADAPWAGDRQATAGAAAAGELMALLPSERRCRVVAGSEVAIADRQKWKRSPATDLIIAEAMRPDDAPLFYAAGGSLTEIAIAWLAEPRIGRRLRLVWIGGREHEGGEGPARANGEYNFALDPVAAQVVFNESDIEIWQVPRDAYRQLLMSSAEIEQLFGASGALGAHLRKHVDELKEALAGAPKAYRQNLGETYILGDSPLVTLTALQSSFEPDTSSSGYVVRPTPLVGGERRYLDRPSGRPMRIYQSIDARLTFGDMTRKFTTLPR